MKEVIDAFTGELKISASDNILRALALGSCIAVVAYDVKNRIGGIAHIMLSGKAPENKKEDENKYAENAISNLLLQMQKAGADKEEMEFCLAGGANVLQRKDDSIGQNNISSVEEMLRDKQIRIAARSLGGIERRCVTLDVETGCLNLSIGNSLEKLFWEFKSSKREIK